VSTLQYFMFSCNLKFRFYLIVETIDYRWTHLGFFNAILYNLSNHILTINNVIFLILTTNNIEFCSKHVKRGSLWKHIKHGTS
jgi:hypothetical protein